MLEVVRDSARCVDDPRTARRNCAIYPCWASSRAAVVERRAGLAATCPSLRTSLSRTNGAPEPAGRRHYRSPGRDAPRATCRCLKQSASGTPPPLLSPYRLCPQRLSRTWEGCLCGKGTGGSWLLERSSCSELFVPDAAGGSLGSIEREACLAERRLLRNFNYTTTLYSSFPVRLSNFL